MTIKTTGKQTVLVFQGLDLEGDFVPSKLSTSCM